jgi:hypothetical protein
VAPDAADDRARNAESVAGFKQRLQPQTQLWHVSAHCLANHSKADKSFNYKIDRHDVVYALRRQENCYAGNQRNERVKAANFKVHTNRFPLMVRALLRLLPSGPLRWHARSNKNDGRTHVCNQAAAREGSYLAHFAKPGAMGQGRSRHAV